MPNKYARLVSINGHILSPDSKYILLDDGDYAYWHKIKSIKGNIVKPDYQIGSTSYDYCFRSDIAGCLETLNRLLEKES